MKEIPLTKGKIAIVSDCDYERLMQHSWCMHPGGYAKARINKKYVLMHRWIMGARDGQEIDHINGNRLDNRRENLRFCNSYQNHQNKHSRNSTSGYKGVSWNKYHKKYRVRLSPKAGDVFLGYFTDPIEGAKAYDRAASEHYGEFADLNFPISENAQ